MAEIIIIEGPSGAGKTTSLRNVDPKESFLLVPNDKKLPWKGGDAQWGKRKVVLKEMNEIPAMLDKIVAQKPNTKYVFVEDHTHFQNLRILSPQFLQAGQSTNKYARWETFGRDVYATIFGKARELPSTMTIVVLAHVQEDANGVASFKTFGKMVGNTVDPVSYARVVLHSLVIAEKKKPEERYVFLTNNDGQHEAKSPIGMFADAYIPNDMAAVLKVIEEYDKVA